MSLPKASRREPQSDADNRQIHWHYRPGPDRPPVKYFTGESEFCAQEKGFINQRIATLTRIADGTGAKKARRKDTRYPSYLRVVQRAPSRCLRRPRGKS